MQKGLLIVFEGIDGSGKTSQICRTKEYLEAKGYEVITTREPGGTSIGTAIRGLLLDPANDKMTAACELLLYGADRAQHLEEQILPALVAGKAVISDRFSLSTVAYQGYGRGLDKALIGRIGEIAACGIVPDKTFVLDVPVEVGFARVGKEQDRLESAGMDFMERVRQGYLTEAAKDKRVSVIDGTQTETAVFAAIRGELEHVL